MWYRERKPWNKLQCFRQPRITSKLENRRDDDELFRIILTQPYIECQRLATKEEIDFMVASKGFQDNGDGKGINYISDHLHLEDMHPANVFIEPNTGSPVCIDCIVKFRRWYPLPQRGYPSGHRDYEADQQGMGCGESGEGNEMTNCEIMNN